MAKINQSHTLDELKLVKHFLVFYKKDKYQLDWR